MNLPYGLPGDGPLQRFERVERRGWFRGIHRLPHPVKQFHRRDERHRHLSLGIAQDAQAQPGRYGQAVHIDFAFGIRTSGADTAVTPVR